MSKSMTLTCTRFGTSEEADDPGGQEARGAAARGQQRGERQHERHAEVGQVEEDDAKEPSSRGADGQPADELERAGASGLERPAPRRTAAARRNGARRHRAHCAARRARAGGRRRAPMPARAAGRPAGRRSGTGRAARRGRPPPREPGPVPPARQLAGARSAARATRSSIGTDEDRQPGGRGAVREQPGRPSPTGCGSTASSVSHWLS